MPSFTRRTLAAAALLSLAAPFSFAQGSGPIKIGLLTIDSGPFASYANLMEQGARTGVDILNAEGGALGRKFELVVQSHSGTPAAAGAGGTKPAPQGGVPVLMGPAPSSDSPSLRSQLHPPHLLPHGT